MLKQPRDDTELLEFYRQLLAACPFLGGKLLTCTFVTADGTAKSIAHGLGVGRGWRGAWVVRNTAASSAIQAYTGSPDPTLSVDSTITVYLTSAADATVEVWVY